MSAPESRLPGPDASPGFQLWRVTLAWQRVMRAALAPHDLTHVQFVLLTTTWWLARAGEPPTQRQLAEQAGTDPMMTSQVVRKLADRGLLTRSDDPGDARAKRLQLTEPGSALVAKALQDVETADAGFFAKLGSRTEAFVAALGDLS